MNALVDDGRVCSAKRSMTGPTATRTGPPEIRMWYDRWIELASPRIEGSIALLRALRAKGVPVFALTNFGSYSYDEARRQAGLPERVRPRIRLGPDGRVEARSAHLSDRSKRTAAFRPTG